MSVNAFRFPVFIAIILSLTACLAPKVIKQEQVLFDTLVADNDHVFRYTLTLDKDRLFYAASGDPAKPALIIIHGTPGSWQQYARYLLDEGLLKNFYVVVIDRPGWGRSLLSEGRQIASFGDQARMIAALAQKLKNDSDNKPVILMGHSLGASIAPRVAMDYPHSVDGLLLFAGTLSPDLSDPRWFNHLAKNAIVSHIIGDRMRKSNKEILSLKAEITSMLGRWDTLKTETIVVQGMRDKLVYPRNVEFAETQLNAEFTEVIRLEAEGHLFPMTRRNDVVSWASCLLGRVASELVVCKK